MLEIINKDGIQGAVHPPLNAATGHGVVLTHGAGTDYTAPLLVALAEQMAAQGHYVLRCNMAFRQRRRTGPPHPSKSDDDRFSLLQAVGYMRGVVSGRIILAGHSYGGRQASMLAAENKSIADHLLLFSYPLHPPEKPQQLRTAHFSKLKIPSTFVHGAADSFGTPEEMRQALELINAETKLVIVERAGHELLKGRFDLAALVGPMGDTASSVAK